MNEKHCTVVLVILLSFDHKLTLKSFNGKNKYYFPFCEALRAGIQKDCSLGYSPIQLPLAEQKKIN
jgi:hypothetical protein